jgi:hypothetical protein
MTFMQPLRIDDVALSIAAHREYEYWPATYGR